MDDAYKIEPRVREKVSENFYKDEFACPHCGVADIVYAGGWVHVDVDEDKPQNVMWVG
mgnify:CR=1 FL=1